MARDHPAARLAAGAAVRYRVGGIHRYALLNPARGTLIGRRNSLPVENCSMKKSFSICPLMLPNAVLPLLFLAACGCSDSPATTDINSTITSPEAPSKPEAQATSQTPSLTVNQSLATTSTAETEATPAKPETNETPAAEAVTPMPLKPKGPQPTRLPDGLLKTEDLTALNPKGTVLFDRAGKRILLKSTVSLTNGLLEMLLCLKETKEHESILTFDGEALAIHSGLLALGCVEGQRVSYSPVYQAPAGARVDVYLNWVDTAGKLHREAAQTWLRHSRFRYYEEKFETLPVDLRLNPDSNLRYDDMNKVLFWYGPMSADDRDALLKLSADPKFKAAIQRFFKESQPRQMEAHWVFVGSAFHEEPGQPRQYLAEGGYAICVANFPMALLDLSVPSSSQGNETLDFEAWTERIPPRGSEVLVELIPHPETTPAPRATAPPGPEPREF